MTDATPLPGSRRLLAVLALAGLLAACRADDPRLATLSVGMSKDSAIVVMGGTPPERPYAYLTGGQYIETLIYRQPGAEGPYDGLRQRDLTPVVVVDGRVTGWGWAHWDSVASAHGIPLEPAQ